MDGPRIQYAATRDGVSIAWYAMGEGEWLLHLPALPLSNLQFEWDMPGYRGWLEWFALQRRLVRFDHRGTGLSSRDVADLSLDAHVSDIEAVIERLGIQRCSVLGSSYAGPIAMALAAKRPELVSRLILWGTHPRYDEVATALPGGAVQARAAITRLSEADFDLFINAYLHSAIGWGEEEAPQFVALARNSIGAAHFMEHLQAYMSFDANEYLPRIQAPTLVLHRPDFHASSAEVAKSLAARIPNARLVMAGGKSIAPFVGNVDQVLNAIGDFLSEDAEGYVPHVAYRRVEHAQRAVRTILFTDMESHTGMMQRLGDDRGREVLRDHERITREAIRRAGGAEVKSLGDGFIASFSSTQAALECAAALQLAFEGHNLAGGEPIRVRVGINAGEPIAEDDDLFGNAVIAANRIAGQASGGEVLVSNVVRELVAGKGFHFADRGQVTLRGMEEPVRVYELHWREVVQPAGVSAP